MSNDVYPSDLRGLGYTVVKVPKFNTIVQTSPAFVEDRILQSQNPIWKWTLLYEVLGNTSRYIPIGESYPDLQRLMGFFLKHQGRYDSFLFDDPDDDSVGPALLIDGVTPNLQAQLQLVNDGAGSPTYYSPVQRNMAGLFYEDVTDLNGGITVYANGIAQVGGGTNYTLLGPGLAIPGYSFGGMYLKWTAAPTGPITAQFNFFFRVRFDTDEQGFEKFVSTLWCVGGPESQNTSSLSLVTARTTSL